jgi:hypothetical protein
LERFGQFNNALVPIQTDARIKYLSVYSKMMTEVINEESMMLRKLKPIRMKLISQYFNKADKLYYIGEKTKKMKVNGTYYEDDDLETNNIIHCSDINNPIRKQKEDE